MNFNTVYFQLMSVRGTMAAVLTHARTLCLDIHVIVMRDSPLIATVTIAVVRNNMEKRVAMMFL